MLATALAHRRGLAGLGALLLFLAVAALATWPALPNAATALPDAGDPAESVWTLHWIAEALVHNPAALYSAPIFHGYPNPLAYDDTSLLPGVLLAPLWLAANHLLFYNLLMWVTLALIGFTAYLLIARLTGSAVAGLVGGLVCAINSYNLAHLSHLNVLSAYLPPLALLGLHALFHPPAAGQRPLVAVGVAAVLVAQALSTFYILAYLLIAVAAYVAWQGVVRRAVWRWPAPWRRRLLWQLAGIATVTAIALGVIIAPYLETQRIMGFERTGEENQAWAARPLDFISVSLHNRTYAARLPHNEPEPLFAGGIALILAAGGLVMAARRPGPTNRGDAPGPTLARSEAGFYAFLLVLGVLLALGPSLDLGGLRIPLPYALLAQLPGASALRAPVRAMVLVNLALAVFAGLGAAGFLRAITAPAGMPSLRGAQQAAQATGILLIASLGTLVLIEQQVAPLALTHLPATEATIPPVYRWLADHPDGGVLMEMPVGLGLRDPVVEATRMYYQTWHGHPLVNGYSSFRPPTYVEMLNAIDAQYADFTPEQLGIMQSLDVHYILYHEATYKRAVWARITAGLGRFREVQKIGDFPTGRFGSHHLFRLAPRPPGAYLHMALAPNAAPPDHVAVRITNPYTYPLLTRLRPTLDLDTGDGRRISLNTPLVLPPGTHTFTAPLTGPALAPGTALVPVAPAPPTIPGGES